MRTNRSAAPLPLWRAERRANDRIPVASKHVIKTVGEFLIPITNQKPHRFRALDQGPRQLPSLLDDPWRGRTRRATGEMHATPAQLDEEEHVESLQPDAVHRKIKARAAQSGMTLFDYLRVEIERIAALPTHDEMLARLHGRTRVKLKRPVAEIIRRERESA